MRSTGPRSPPPRACMRSIPRRARMGRGRAARLRAVLAESLHGAVFAGALGVPWRAVALARRFNDFKWHDWHHPYARAARPRAGRSRVRAHPVRHHRPPARRCWSAARGSRATMAWISPAGFTGMRGAVRLLRPRLVHRRHGLATRRAPRPTPARAREAHSCRPAAGRDRRALPAAARRPAAAFASVQRADAPGAHRHRARARPRRGGRGHRGAHDGDGARFLPAVIDRAGATYRPGPARMQGRAWEAPAPCALVRCRACRRAGRGS